MDEFANVHGEQRRAVERKFDVAAEQCVERIGGSGSGGNSNPTAIEQILTDAHKHLAEQHFLAREIVRERWPETPTASPIVSSDGAGLCRELHRLGERVIEIDHPARPARRNGSKTDALDAVRAARKALSRELLGELRSGDDREALRVLTTTRKPPVHACTQAVNAVHALVVIAPEAIRGRLR